MRKTAYIVIAVMTVASIAAVVTGATHHAAMLGVCIVMGLIAWSTRDEDDDIVEFKDY